MSARLPIALTIAGSDSGGGAGIAMDLKVFAALGAFGACAITALTAQNSVGVRGYWEAPPESVAAQIEAVLADLPIGAAKTGMLASEAIVRAVANVLGRRVNAAGQELVAGSIGQPPGLPRAGSGAAVPLVVDPVIVAKDGSRLLSEKGAAAVRQDLVPLATIITPNIAEAEQLSGLAIESHKDMAQAAEKLRALGCDWVLIKGGHLSGQAATDYLLGPEGAQIFSSPRLPGGPFHGTGCALSAAITAHLARGRSVAQAVAAGRKFVQGLLSNAQALGKGSLLLHPATQTDEGNP